MLRLVLQEAVEAVIGTLGMQPCEGTEAVPPNARSHTVLLAGIFLGDQQVSTAAVLQGLWWACGADHQGWSIQVGLKYAVRGKHWQSR